MGILSDPARSALVDHARNVAAYAPAANHFAHAFVAGVEVVGNGYAAASFANTLASWPAAAARVKSNGVQITFPNPTGSWGSIDEIRITDSAAPGGGMELGRHTLAAPIPINAGTGPLRIAVGGIVITAPAGGFTNTVVHELLDLMFGAVANVPRVTTWGSFYAGDPQGAGAPVGGRVAITQAATWSAAGSGLAITLAPIAIPDQVATFWAEHDAAAAGVLLFSAVLPQPPSGGTIPAGGLRTNLM